jgi:RNA polymerase sigma-70 factor (ECF subfamily)
LCADFLRPGILVDYKKFDDESLIRLIAKSQPEALGELYERHNRLVFGMAVNAVGDQALAEEITQDVFLRVWNKASTYQAEQGKVTNWIAGIARNRAIDVFRHQRSRPERNSISWEEMPLFDLPDSQDVEQEIEVKHKKQRIQQALFQLPQEQREALALAYFRGYTHEEAAEALGQPLGTIKTRIRLGMQKLRQLLAEEQNSAG